MNNNQLSSLRFLVVSYSVPVQASGTPKVVRAFLENFKSDEVVLIGRPSGKKSAISNYKFHYPILKIPSPPVGTRGEQFWKFLSVFTGLITGFIAIRQYRPKAILAFYRDEGSLLLGYLLHKISGLEFYPYFCDLYLENYPSGIKHCFAEWLQKRVFNEATKVLTLTKPMGEHFKKKYSVESLVLQHCVNWEVPGPSELVVPSSPFKIGYLGGVNLDRIASLRLLAQATHNDPNFEICYFTPNLRGELERYGVLNENSRVAFIPEDEHLFEELSKCDTLFLPAMPISSNPEREEQLVTGFPTKALDYFLVQCPILVHSSPNYFISSFFREFQCGLVANGAADSILAALQELRKNLPLRQSLVMNGLSVLSQFHGPYIANQFRAEMQSVVRDEF